RGRILPPSPCFLPAPRSCGPWCCLMSHRLLLLSSLVLALAACGGGGGGGGSDGGSGAPSTPVPPSGVTPLPPGAGPGLGAACASPAGRVLEVGPGKTYASPAAAAG